MRETADFGVLSVVGSDLGRIFVEPTGRCVSMSSICICFPRSFVVLIGTGVAPGMAVSCGGGSIGASVVCKWSSSSGTVGVEAAGDNGGWA